jgi:phosphoribulokinase
MERKLKLKRQFDTEYDDGGEGKASFYEDLKKEVDEQANLNRAEWEGMEDAQRVLYEGFRPGMYVRIEIKVSPHVRLLTVQVPIFNQPVLQIHNDCLCHLSEAGTLEIYTFF